MFNMKELLKTLAFCGGAALLVLAAGYHRATPVQQDRATDQGGIFYPQFTDPQAPKSIEVVDFDEATASVRPLKVEYKNRRWTLPSHNGYPADAQERLAKTAAALIELKKEGIVSDKADDQLRYGVIDPLDTRNTNLTGRGKRVTLRDAQNAILADFILGKAVEGKPGYRYVRLPGQSRIYRVKTDAEPSSQFQDWMETDLLKLNPADVRKIVINNYSLNETSGTLQSLDSVSLTKNQAEWTLGVGGTPQKAKVDQLLSALARLRIADVQPKPMGLSQELKTPEGIRLSAESVISLRQKGFFITPQGQLLSNEGEVMVETALGIQYTLRFGEVANPGISQTTQPTGGAPSAKDPSAKEPAKEKSNIEERRYLFITVNYSPEKAAKYAEAGSLPGDRGKKLADELRNRFADWYYVISGTDFKKIRPHKKDLL
jgi:hypothetical protein